MPAAESGVRLLWRAPEWQAEDAANGRERVFG